MKNANQNDSCVYITGAGPGDPGLLTLKAKEIIRGSDIIAYDNLVSKEILELALFINPKLRLIYVGKVGEKKEKTVSQDKINNLLVKLSKEYKIICRLKGGDPNIFGRGGEEALFLKEHNINFEIVPGVSSISAVPAYAGIPLTHRDCNSSFTVITAHEDPFEPDSKVNWESFDAINSTLILLMGVKNLPKIIEKLILLDRKKDTPLAVIYWGTTSKQKIIITTLENALNDIQADGIEAPSVIIIGEVVKYREMLSWFENKKLFGKKILVTRAKDQSFSFAEKLIQTGAKPVSCPLVSYKLIEKELCNKDIINNISRFEWIFFTSNNAVKFFFEILNKNYYDSRALSKSQIATVGYKTKLELEKYNIKADFVPKKFSFNDLIKELSEKININEKAVLYPTQPNATDCPQLTSIKRWEIYKPEFVENLEEEQINQIKEGIDIITLFSPSTAEHFKKLTEKYNLHEVFNDSLIAVIGDETARTCKKLFGRVDIIADPFTEEGLVQAMEKYFAIGAGVVSAS